MLTAVGHIWRLFDGLVRPDCTALAPRTNYGIVLCHALDFKNTLCLVLRGNFTRDLSRARALSSGLKRVLDCFVPCQATRVRLDTRTCMEHSRLQAAVHSTQRVSYGSLLAKFNAALNGYLLGAGPFGCCDGRNTPPQASGGEACVGEDQGRGGRAG